MKKTLRQWFEMFPEPYRTQAIENTIALSGETRLEGTYKNVVDALAIGFLWSRSPQGLMHWTKFCDQLDRNEIVLTEPSEGGGK
jgi:hypothetical protein